jgi:hypothetical protein
MIAAMYLMAKYRPLSLLLWVWLLIPHTTTGLVALGTFLLMVIIPKTRPYSLPFN